MSPVPDGITLAPTAVPERRCFRVFDPCGQRMEFIPDGGGSSQTRPAGERGERPRLYTDLAVWWPLFSPASDYEEEAAELVPFLQAATAPPPRTVLELGAGGGSLAFHLKRFFELTLTDLSPEMLAVSRQLNPECRHVVGDMRTLDLGRQFDLVLIHDAIMYMTDAASVGAALNTAYRHCRPGGAVVVLPDAVKETFAPKTSTGGHDAPDGRGLRYLEWIWDPNPGDDTYEVMFAFLLRERDGSVRIEHDRHRFGIFPRAAWLKWLEETGFVPSSHTDRWGRAVFVGAR